MKLLVGFLHFRGNLAENLSEILIKGAKKGTILQDRAKILEREADKSDRKRTKLDAIDGSVNYAAANLISRYQLGHPVLNSITLCCRITGTSKRDVVTGRAIAK